MDLKNISYYTKDLSILYIEDDITVKKQIESILKLIFLDVQSVENAELALDGYINYHEQYNKYFDLVLSDIKLPNMNGVELSGKILEINPKQQIIIVSAYREKEKLQELIALGINSYIPKPIDRKYFFDIIEKSAMFITQESEKLENLRQIEKNKNDTLLNKSDIKLKKLKDEFEIYKENSNKNIQILTQKNSAIYRKNNLNENKIYDLKSEIKNLKELIIQLEKE